MAYVGVAKEEDEWRSSCMTPSIADDNRWPINNLCVLCSCSLPLKRRLVDLSKDALDWDADPPTVAAQSEGDGPYLQVSREIRGRAEAIIDKLKACALEVHHDVDRCNPARLVVVLLSLNRFVTSITGLP